MKRSRACDDLVALAAETSTPHTETRQYDGHTWPSSLVDTCHGFKRSRASVDSPTSNSSNGDEINGFSLHLTVVGDACGYKSLSRRSVSPFRSSVEVKELEEGDDRLPFRRNLRETMRFRQKKQRVAEITSSFDGFGIHDDNDAAAKQSSVQSRGYLKAPVEARETSEPRFRRGLCFPHQTGCIDPLDKRQGPSFDLSALIRLSVSRKR
uniref:Uncharacterized protein n=1 Tax=Hyaloperonospora arabidopsidis (strain Emoy2) TaxID=559515 RepID=M4B5N4_HYAAE